MVHDGAIYILGGWGMVMLDDVWKSADGVTWTKVRHHITNTSRRRRRIRCRRWWPASSQEGSELLLADRPVVLTDWWVVVVGQVRENGPWSKRMFHVAVTFKGYIYLLGGFDGSVRGT